jgi:hypothetical protein
MSSRPITSTDQHGNKQTIPVTLNAGNVFRVYCDRILADQTVEITADGEELLEGVQFEDSVPATRPA